jgi:hypothetical protein
MGKGMRIAAETLLFFVIIVIVLALALGAANTASGFVWEDYFTATSGLGDKGDIDTMNPQIETKSAGASELDHIFSNPGEAHDISELACLIGDQIYTDFSKYGESSRTSKESFKNAVPFDTDVGYFVDGGSFIYEEKRTDTSKPDTVFDEDYPDCHICKSGSTGITRLDEICINMQLKDRYAGSDKFCGPGNIDAPAGTRVAFGNDNAPNLNTGVSGWGSDIFCGNDEDRIWWYANGIPSWSEKWKASYVRRPEDGYNSISLASGWHYVYGLFWSPEGKHYDVFFSLIPDGNIRTTANFNDILGILNDKSFIRLDVLGNKYWEARSVAAFKVTLNNDISVGQGITDIINAGLTQSDATCSPCSGDGCFDAGISESQNKVCAYAPFNWNIDGVKNNLDKTNVKIFVDARDEDGNPVGCSGSLVVGKEYRVVINEWVDMFREQGGIGEGSQWGSCFSTYDRTVIIQEVT